MKYDSFEQLWDHLKGRDPEIIPVEGEGMGKYKLNEVITAPTTFYVQRSSGTGKTKWGSIRLDPGKEYVTDDAVLLDSLMARGYVRVPYNEALKNKLEELGKEYEVEVCKSCGGRIKKLKYHAVEFV